ncbi:hypothetical protein BCR34DRAFT_372180 [Clohesyomyces aquaticus]|uniref:MHYT domain-containing protein n=1 Tax=Clohesyomyces aquaticus TaxID=1231657 RepID=A0A1Y1ZH74_9PLEO|nr:hypothetical protein BCR34DRAFT_372180 [Clohesyomyces aquaticus]
MESNITNVYPIGSEPNIHYLPWLIFLSYVVSLIGAITTVELLHRRVAGAGWRNWVQLGACSVSFGLVAIWCMHFVGNRAIVLGKGEEEIQLYYSSTFTAVSAILPIIVIFMGLLVADHFHKGMKGRPTRYFAMLTCGICSGAAVTEMHYLGNNGTTDYRLLNDWRHIAGAAGIAVGACIVSFALFFHWSAHWMNTLWRRLIVACFLALAVSGMHWTAAAGTRYQIIGYHEGPGTARNVNMIIAICLCLSACGVCFALGFLKQRLHRILKERAQQVVLAVATFDEEGRLLVTQSGLMPCQTITRQFHQRTFDEEFSTTHAVFQWIYRISRNWGGIVDLVPFMRDHLVSTGYLQTYTPVMGGTSRTSIGYDDHPNYSSTFRELFCVTAQDIARSLDTRLQDLGCLYEDLFTTGTLSSNLRIIRREPTGGNAIIAAEVAASPGDVETGVANSILFGKGQMLVLTRKVATEEANRLQNAGYRFANLEQIGEPLARSLQIPREELSLMVARLQLFCNRKPWVPTTGTYLAAFLIQPSPSFKGLDIIVPRHTPDRLPLVPLSPNAIMPSEAKLLAQLDGMSLDECLVRIVQNLGTAGNESDLCLERFRNAIKELLKEVPESVLRCATFSSQPLRVNHGGSPNDSNQARVIAFCGIKEVYNQSLQSKDLRHVPLSFFACQQRVYPGCPDHAILARKTHTEFSTLLAGSTMEKQLPPRPGSKWPWPFSKSRNTSELSMQPDNSSEKGLFNVTPYASTDATNNPRNILGGIMVSQDVVISENTKDGCQMEMIDFGLSSVATGVEDREQLTLVDKLMSITTSFRDPHTRS